MIQVVLDGLVKRSEGVAVIDGLSLEIHPGELMAVIAPPGGGKTALARLIAGLDVPDQGEILFEGRTMSRVPPQERRVGLVFQDESLWPHLNVAENVGYSLRTRHVARKERRQRVDEALSLVRIDSLSDHRPDSLSAPQRQRVALARALALDPDVLVLDELLGPFEEPSRFEFRDELRALRDEIRTTVLLLTRDPRDALSLADRVAVLDLGRIAQVGEPFSVYNRPTNERVAQILGPVNFLQGQVESVDSHGDVVIRTPMGRLIGQSVGSKPEVGTSITAAIRPESLWLGPTVPAKANRFVALVERQIFLGALRQIHLRHADDWPLLAWTLQSQVQGLRDGQPLTVAVLPEHVIVLPPESNRGP